MKKYIPIITAFAFLLNGIFLFERVGDINFFNIIFSLIWIVGFFTIVYLNAPNKTFKIVSWSVFVIGNIGLLLTILDLNLPKAVHIIIAWVAAIIPFLIFAGLLEVGLIAYHILENLSSGEKYISFDNVMSWCYFAFLLLFAITYFISVFVHKKHKKDPNKRKTYNL